MCCQAPTLCSQFNVAEGVCLQCYQGYSVDNGTCKVSPQNEGCALWSGNSCIQCSKAWYFSNGVCTPVSDQCRTWSNTTGACLTCYNGYLLNGRNCVVDNNPTSNNNPLCAIWDGPVCLQCAERCYFNPSGICVSVSDQCQTWDPLDGFCLTCYRGYALNNGLCIESPQSQTPSDLGCAIWNSAADLCLECSQRYFFNGQQCVPVSDQCQTWNLNTGACLTCYKGYNLMNQQCVKTPEQQVSDLGCATWDWDAQRCLKCSNNWVFNNLGVCVPVSD